MSLQKPSIKNPIKNKPKKHFEKHLAQQDLLTFFLHGGHLMRNKRFTDHVKGKKKSSETELKKNKDASGHNSIYYFSATKIFVILKTQICPWINV